MKVKDAIDFIRANDVDHEHLSDEHLTLMIHGAMNHHAFDYVTDEQNKLVGLYIGRWERPYTEFRVLLFVGRGSFKTLFTRFKQQHQDFTEI